MLGNVWLSPGTNTSFYTNLVIYIYNTLCGVFVALANAKTELESCCTDV